MKCWGLATVVISKGNGRIFSQGYKVFFSLFTSMSSNISPFQRTNVSENIFVDRIWVTTIKFSLKNRDLLVILVQKSD